MSTKRLKKQIPTQVALGRRLAAIALDLDAAAHGDLTGDGGARGRGFGGSGQGARGRTLVHGDLKTWNVFFADNASNNGVCGTYGEDGGRGMVKFIDWQVGCIIRRVSSGN